MSNEATAFDYAQFDEMMFSSRLVFACAFAIIVWEQILSFKDEYKIVWQSGNRWSIAKVIFVINRYFAITGLILFLIWFNYVPEEVCNRAHWLPIFFCAMSLMAGDTILSLRTFALWEKNLVVAMSLGSLLTGQLVYGVYVLHENTPFRTPEGSCISMVGQSLQKLEVYNNVCCLLFELLAAVLIFVRVYKYRRSGAAGGLIETIFTDSGQYFVIVFCAKLMMNLNIWLNKDLPTILMPPTIAVASILCSRVFFSLFNESRTPSSVSSSNSNSWRQRLGDSRNPVQRHSFKLKGGIDPNDMEMEEALQQIDAKIDVECGTFHGNKQ